MEGIQSAANEISGDENKGLIGVRDGRRIVGL